MKLVNLIYCSRIKHDTDPSELARIHEASNRNNPKSNLTGILVFGEDIFLQCVEGGRSEVNSLYSKICRDPRHENVVLISYSNIAKREFEEWDMKLVLMTEKNKNLLLTYSSSKKFDPLEMNPESVYSFLLSLKQK